MKKLFCFLTSLLTLLLVSQSLIAQVTKVDFSNYDDGLRGWNWDGTTASYIAKTSVESTSYLYIRPFDGHSFAPLSKDPIPMSKSDKIKGWNWDGTTASYFGVDSGKTYLFIRKFDGNDFGPVDQKILMSNSADKQNLRGWTWDGTMAQYLGMQGGKTYLFTRKFDGKNFDPDYEKKEISPDIRGLNVFGGKTSYGFVKNGKTRITIQPDELMPNPTKVVDKTPPAVTFYDQVEGTFRKDSDGSPILIKRHQTDDNYGNSKQGILVNNHNSSKKVFYVRSEPNQPNHYFAETDNRYSLVFTSNNKVEYHTPTSTKKFTKAAAITPPAITIYDQVNGTFKRDSDGFAIIIRIGWPYIANGEIKKDIFVRNYATTKIVSYIQIDPNQPNHYFAETDNRYSLVFTSNNTAEYRSPESVKKFTKEAEEKARKELAEELDRITLATSGIFKYESSEFQYKGGIERYTVKKLKNKISVTDDEGSEIIYDQDKDSPNLYWNTMDRIEFKDDYFEIFDFTNLSKYKRLTPEEIAENARNADQSTFASDGIFEWPEKKMQLTIKKQKNQISVKANNNLHPADLTYNQDIYSPNEFIAIYNQNKHVITFTSRNTFILNDVKFNRYVPSVEPVYFKVDGNDVKKELKDIGLYNQSQNFVSFSLAVSNKVDDWKAIKVFDKNGNQIRLIERDGDNRQTKGCQAVPISDFDTTVKVEFHKAKMFGTHTYITTKYFNLSKIKGKVLAFTWMDE